MGKERYNQLIGEMYENYKTKTEMMMGHGFHGTLLSQEEFINKCKTDLDFSKIWGLNIEERELSLEERSFLAGSNHSEVSQNIKAFTGIDEDHTLHKQLDYINTPTRAISLTYNNETIEIYE